MQDKYLRKLDIKLVDGEFENSIKEQVKTPEQVHGIFQSIKEKAHETLIAVYLDTDLKALAYNILSTGTKSETVLDFDDIYGYGFVLKAKYFILVHNHPSGDPEPSDGDRDVIHKFKDYENITMKPLDFIIVGKESYWSMFEKMEGGEYTLGAVDVSLSESKKDN